MEITIFKMFIWGDISSVIWSEISFYGDAVRRRKTKLPLNEISDLIPNDIPPQMNILNTVIP